MRKICPPCPCRRRSQQPICRNSLPRHLAQPQGQTITISTPPDLTASPRQHEPEELAVLLEMKGTAINDTAVNLMRPSAIREAAQLVTFQTAIAWRYKQLVASTEAHSAIMDTAFNFDPLLMTQGDALILPPVLTRAGASLRIESGETATAAQTSYELLAPAPLCLRGSHMARISYGRHLSRTGKAQSSSDAEKRQRTAHLARGCA